MVGIGGFAALTRWESVRRLLEPGLIDHTPRVIVAVIGAIGGELVARYRIRVGREIGSEALVADGRCNEYGFIQKPGPRLVRAKMRIVAYWSSPVCSENPGQH